MLNAHAKQVFNNEKKCIQKTRSIVNAFSLSLSVSGNVSRYAVSAASRMPKRLVQLYILGVLIMVVKKIK